MAMTSALMTQCDTWKYNKQTAGPHKHTVSEALRDMITQDNTNKNNSVAYAQQDTYTYKDTQHYIVCTKVRMLVHKHPMVTTLIRGTLVVEAKVSASLDKTGNVIL